MTETTEEKQNDELAKSHINISEQLFELQSQVTSLTKERDELAFSLKHRDKLIKHLKSQLSNRDKEIEELKQKQKWKFSMMGFQAQVGSWIVDCFGKETAFDRTERNWRFIEEALELIQALGANAEDAHKMVDYTFSREKGAPAQEVGGVMVTLAALCEANELLIHKNATTELERITAPAMMNKIRAKHASKPHKSPLPGDYKFAEEALASLNKEGEEE